MAKKIILDPGYAFSQDKFINLFGGDFSPSAYDYLKNEFLFSLGLINSESSPAPEIDILKALHTLVPSGCSHELIRIGQGSDGGYLVPDDLSSIDACFSPGVGGILDFEQHLSSQYSIPSYMCDNTQDPSELDLDPSFHFFAPKRIGSCSCGDLISIDDWVVSSDHASSSDLLLQMDIEGSEYSSLLATSDSILSKFRIIVLELHYVNFLFNPYFLNSMFNPLMRKISSMFDCVHIHPNTGSGGSRYIFKSIGKEAFVPVCMELTFYRKSLNLLKRPVILPHPLDVANDDNSAPYPLGYPWL